MESLYRRRHRNDFRQAPVREARIRGANWLASLQIIIRSISSGLMRITLWTIKWSSILADLESGLRVKRAESNYETHIVSRVKEHATGVQTGGH